MPRQIDLRPQNLKVTNDPNNQLGFTQEQIVNLQSQIPEALEKAQLIFINSVLEAIDQATGWDLLDFAKQVEAQLGNTGNLGADLWNYIFGVGNNGTTALQQLSAIIQGIFGGTGTVFDFTAWLQQVETNATNAWNELEDFFTTGDWADLTAAWDDLFGITNQANNNATNALQQLSMIIQGIVGAAGNPFDLVSWLQNVEANASAAFQDIEDFLATGDWSDLTAAIQEITQAIFGSSTNLGLVGAIPAPAVTNVVQNIQPVWDFPDAASVSAGGQWSWDGTVDHTGVAGSGSAKCIANGVLQALKGMPGAVQAGQVVTPQAWVQWSGLTYTGSNPIQLQLVPYSQSGSELVAGSPVVVAQLAAPSSSGSWTELTSTYTVPSTGVTAVQLRLVVEGTVTAGNVWWDDCEANVTGGYLATLQNDLTTLQSDSTASTAAFATFITSVESAISGYTNWSTFITAVESAWSTYSTTESGLTSSAIFTLQNFFNTAFGVNTSTGQIASTNITNSLGGASLGADVQAILDYIANALGHAGTGHTLTQIETYLGLIPPANVTNVYGGSSLSNDLSNLSTWLFGTTTPASTIQIQASAVPGVQGITDIGTTMQTMWDNFANSIASALGLTGIVSSGNSLSALTGAVQGHAQATSTALSTAQTAATTQAQQATAKPGYMAIDATMDAVFPLSHMIAAPTYNNVTQSSSTMGFIRTSDNVAKQAVAWLGSYTGTISALYINVYSMNTTTGVLTDVVAGSNIIGSVGTALSWNYYDLPSAITAAPGHVYAVEMVVAGSGTYSLMGLANSTFPQNSAVYPQALGASRAIVPTHDATGAGSFTASSTTSFSWSHILGSAATAILVEFVSTAPVSSVKIGTTSATLLGSETFNGGSDTAYMYGLLNPPTGTQTITVTLSSAGYLSGNSDSYNGVSSFGTVATNTGTTTTASVSVSSASGQIAAAMLCSFGTSPTFNQTSRWSGGNSSSNLAEVFGDAAGASTVSFTGTTIYSMWAAIGLSLIGGTATAPATISSPTYSTSVPWFGLGNTAITSTPVFAPETTAYFTAGTYTLTVPAWVNFIDGIAVGGGGGGGGGINGAGSPGGTTTITIGSHTITATGGAGGPGGTTTTPNAYGQTPGNETYLGTTYYGGSQVYYAQNGSSPGGGGGAGYYSGLVGWGGTGGSWSANTYAASGVTTVSITVGGGGAPNTFGSPSYGACPGAAGGAWVVFRQS